MRNDELGFQKPKAMAILHQLKFYQATVHGKKGNMYRYRDEKQAIGDNEFCKPNWWSETWFIITSTVPPFYAEKI